MEEFSEHIVFVFFTGSLFMALIYHLALAIIQRNRLLLLYSAYLFASTAFLAERVSLDFLFTPSADISNSFYFNLLDEPIQMLMYFTYLRFAARAIDIFHVTDSKFVRFYRLVLSIILIYTFLYISGITFHWYDRRPSFAFIGIRIILMTSLVALLVSVSKYVLGLFFKIIILGSSIMFAGNLLAFITSVTGKPILGLYGVMWTCVALFFDVICFSAALGYTARKSLLEKQYVLNELLIKEKLLQQQELEKMNAVYEAREADRNRIARDLHDEIGSTLSSIHIYSSVAEKTLQSSPEKTRHVLEQINTNTRMVMESMNDIVWAMKTGRQQDVIMSNKIKNIGYEMLDAKNINCCYEIADAADKADLDIDLRRNILLIVKESLNNIVKYSDASQVTIKINLQQGNLGVSICDNGIGFNTDTAYTGNGLKNMRYRVMKYGGDINIFSDKAGGTVISCNFPITNNRDETEPAEY